MRLVSDPVFIRVGAVGITVRLILILILILIILILILPLLMILQNEVSIRPGIH